MNWFKRWWASWRGRSQQVQVPVAALDSSPAETNPVAGMSKEILWALLEELPVQDLPSLDRHMAHYGYSEHGQARQRIATRLAGG